MPGRRFHAPPNPNDRAAKSVSPARAAFYTRMIETWKLLAPSAPLKANLPEDKRSPVLFRAGEEQKNLNSQRAVPQ